MIQTGIISGAKKPLLLATDLAVRLAGYVLIAKDPFLLALDNSNAVHKLAEASADVSKRCLSLYCFLSDRRQRNNVLAEYKEAAFSEQLLVCYRTMHTKLQH